MSTSKQTADAIIVGGGLHGCATALYLAMRGVNCAVLEKDYVGRHASGVNAGGVRRLGRALPEVPLADTALSIWRNIEDLIDDDCGFKSLGQVKVAENNAELSALKNRAKTVQDIGFLHEEIIDQKQLRELLPAVASHCIGGLYVNGDGHANPYRTVTAFKRKAISMGVRIFEQTPVNEIVRHGKNWLVKSPSRKIEAPIIVNCAGAWGGSIAAQLGDYAPVEAQALMLMISAQMPHFVKPVVGSQGRTLSFKQFDNGTVMMGGAYQGSAEPEQNNTHLSFNGLAKNARAATAIFPIMRQATIVRSWAGIEGVMPDNIPVIGAGSADGVYHAFGFSAHGFALGPLVGKIITDLIDVGDIELPIDAFRIQRFSQNKDI
ncbi:MAG: NAD(P)/FAD-dependent oxidoreductase [Rhodospirillales bacterium]|jgi:sarcosine oxidase subunit beta|tara:strand:+ start:892 stop:2022 length:1131 start_codon:yes stop_codon:yes gene_type:complete